jgi:hypothetical protein
MADTLRAWQDAADSARDWTAEIDAIFSCMGDMEDTADLSRALADVLPRAVVEAVDCT